jgi:isoquinoline 1-oxidoreductase beta subunit
VKPKTNGTAIYGSTSSCPGMKYASIEKPLQIGGKVASFDATAALKYPGVRKVIQVPSGVAVIADNTWAAFPRPQAAQSTWAPGPNAGVSTESIYAKARALSEDAGRRSQDGRRRVDAVDGQGRRRRATRRRISRTRRWNR